MARKPRRPAQLLHGPFTIDEARRVGLERWHLRGASWRRLSRGSYVSAAEPDDPMLRLADARRRLPPSFAFSGSTAAWLHGLDVAPCNPIEATVPPSAGVSGRAGIALRREALDCIDIVYVRGHPATSIGRTLAELCTRLPLIEAVAILDSALHARKVSLQQLTSWADARAGQRGVRSLRRVLAFAEPASESPMESRLRMLLILGGLPRPRAQVSIHDNSGRFIGRPDLYYADHRLGLEYDGAVHRGSLAADNRRQNALLDAGVRLLRFTAGDVMGNPGAVVTQVAALLKN